MSKCRNCLVEGIPTSEAVITVSINKPDKKNELTFPAQVCDPCFNMMVQELNIFGLEMERSLRD